MKWTTATLALLSLGSLLLTGKVLLRPERATPAEILDSVQLARSRGLTDAALLLRDLDRLLAEETGLPVLVAEDPLTCVVRGAGMALDRMDKLGSFFSYE